MTTDTTIAANPVPGSAPLTVTTANEIDKLSPATTDPVTPPASPPAAPVTPPAAPPTAPASETIIDPPKPPEPPATEGWRERMAGGDNKVLERLKRFADEGAFFQSYKALESKLSSGELKKTLSENPTPEELTAYRKENSIPETPELYDLNLPNGLVIGEADQPMVSEFTKAMHSINAPHGVVKQALATYYKIQENNLTSMAEQNRLAKQNTEDALRAEWGPDFRQHVNVLKSYTDTMPAELKDALFAAKLPNGAQFMNTPQAIKFFTQMAMDANPAMTVVPNSSSPGPDIDAEMASIKAKMGTNDYVNNPKLAERYMALKTAKDRMAARG